MKFEVVKNSKSLTRCLDAVVKTDNDKCLSFEEVNEFVKTDNLLDYLTDMGVENCYIQDGGTAAESFIPAFDGEGV